MSELTPVALDALEQECTEALLQGGRLYMTITRQQLIALIAGCRERDELHDILDTVQRKYDAICAEKQKKNDALTAERDTLRAENAELRREVARLTSLLAEFKEAAEANYIPKFEMMREADAALREAKRE